MRAISLLSSFKTIGGIESGPEGKDRAGSFVWHGSDGFLSEHRAKFIVYNFRFVRGITESVSLTTQCGNTHRVPSHALNEGPEFILFQFPSIDLALVKSHLMIFGREPDVQRWGFKAWYYGVMESPSRRKYL